MSERQQHHKLYSRAIWRGPNGVKLMKLRRDPMCEILGCTRPATCVDHRKKHNGDFFLFCGGVNLENLRSLCAPHHDAKKERYEDGKEEYNPVSATGAQGRQFQVTTISARDLDRAIGTKQELADLLKDIPDYTP